MKEGNSGANSGPGSAQDISEVSASDPDAVSLSAVPELGGSLHAGGHVLLGGALVVAAVGGAKHLVLANGLGSGIGGGMVVDLFRENLIVAKIFVF